MDNGAETVGSYKVGSRDSHPGVRTAPVPPVGSIPTGTFPTPAPTLSTSGRAFGADDDYVSIGFLRLLVRFPRNPVAVHTRNPSVIAKAPSFRGAHPSLRRPRRSVWPEAISRAPERLLRLLLFGGRLAVTEVAARFSIASSQ